MCCNRQQRQQDSLQENATNPAASACGFPSADAAAHLFSVIESTEDLIFSVDLEYRLVTFNSAFALHIQKNWGVTAQAGMAAVDLLAEPRAALWPPLFARAVSDGPYLTEYALRDGRWLELSFHPIVADGAVVGISVFGKDITERKLAEEFRKNSEKRFRTLIEQAPNAIAIGRDGIHLYVNRKYLEMFGLESADRVVGRSLGERIAPEWRSIVEERSRQRALGVPMPAEYEAVGLKADGSRFAIQISVTCVELADGPAIIAFLTDISERKSAEEALRSSEARFRGYFNRPLVGMAMTSPGKRFLTVNDRICEIFGYSREELLAMDWVAITHPGDLQANFTQFDKMLAGELEGYSLDKRFIRKDGQTVWTTISVGCVRKPDGTVDYACLSVQDISKRRQAEEALRASEARFRTLVENAPSAITISRNGVILYANRKCAEMFGEENAQDMISRVILDYFAPDTRREIEELRDRYSKGEIDSAVCEGIALRGMDIQFPVHIEATVVGLPDGPAILTFLNDVTARKASEELIREAERQYRDIFTEAPEGIYRVTKGGRLLAVNPAGARMLGYDSPEECLERGADMAHNLWLRPEDRSRYTNLLEETGYLQGFQSEFKCKDGSPIWISMSARRVADQDGHTLYYQGFLENLSEKKQLEHDLKDRIREIQLLSEMNNVLLHATTEQDLLEEYCRIAVETGGYRMAWVGFADTGPEKRVIPVAHFGHEDGYLQTANVTWDDTEHGSGPVGRAIKSGHIEVVELWSSDDRTRPWQPEAIRRGYQSAIAIPFRHSDGGMACLTAYGSSHSTWSESELKLMNQIASALGFGITTLRTGMAKERYQRDLAASLEQTIEVISQAVDQRDPYTSGHQKRVADLCTHIARRMGMEPDRIQGLRLAATIHDLGKIGIPAEILAKPGKLTPIQYELIKEHPQLGYEIVRNVQFPWPIGEIIRQHHERLDGSGYPRGLRGDATLLEARILAVADVVEAMDSHRPYRAGRGIDVALAEILNERGTRYDENVVNACVALFRESGYAFPD